MSHGKQYPNTTLIDGVEGVPTFGIDSQDWAGINIFPMIFHKDFNNVNFV